MARGGARIPSGAGPNVDREHRVLRLAAVYTSRELWGLMQTPGRDDYDELRDALGARLRLVEAR